jgi:hypothetical protein
MNYAKNSENPRTPPQSHPWISQTAEALEARFGGDDMHHWVMLCPKTLGLQLPRKSGIADHTNSTKDKELHPKTIESRWFPDV